MADHYLEQISAAIKARLTGLPTTGARVSDDDDEIKESTDLPRIDIYVGEAPRQRKGTVGVGNGEQKIHCENDITVMLKLTVAANTNMRRQLRLIAKEVEAAWLPATARTLGNIARDTELVNIGEPQVVMSGETRIGQMTMQFQVRVRSFEGEPDLA